MPGGMTEFTSTAPRVPQACPRHRRSARALAAPRTQAAAVPVSPPRIQTATREPGTGLPRKALPWACARPDLRPHARGRHSPSEGTRPRAAAASPASGRRSMKGRRHRPRGRTSQSSAAPARPLSAPQRNTSARRRTRLSQRASWSELRRPRPAFQGRTSAQHDAAPAG